MKTNLLNIQELLNKTEEEFKKINPYEIVGFMNKNKSNPLSQLELLKWTVNDFINETKDTEYVDQYVKSIFWIFGVWEDYLNDDMKNDLKELVDKIYEDWFADWSNEVEDDDL